MASILKRPSYQANLPRHGHDLSRRVLFTSSVGHLLPVLTDFLSPGDKVKLNESLFTRTQPLKTCAFIRLNEHVEYFFVPMSQIDPYFNNAFYGISDFDNTNDLNLGAKSGVTNPDGYVKGISAPSASLNASILFSDFYRYWIQVPMGSKSPEDSDLRPCQVLSGKDIYEVYNASPSYMILDEYNIPRWYNFVRLASMLGYSECFSTGQYANLGAVDVFGQNNPRINLYRFAAYQKIWFDYYRLSDWDPNEPFSYNFGYINKLDNPDSSVYLNKIYVSNLDDHILPFQLFAMRYRPLKKDYFTSVLPTPYFNPVSSPSGYGKGLMNSNFPMTSVQSFIASAYGVQLQAAVNLQSNPWDISNGGIGLDSQASMDIIGNPPVPTETMTLQQHRLMYAYEELLAITQRAGKHYDDQTLAHFGYRVPQGVSNEVYFLGGHTSHLQIGEVVATAAGQNGDNNSSLGEIAGRGLGVSNDNKTIKFTAPCHGILMAIYSAIPDVEYRAFGIEYQNMINNINMWPRPEFDNIGMQPLWLFESNMQNCTPVTKNLFIGWQYRYASFKLSFDSIHGAFNYTLRDWTLDFSFGSISSTQIYPSEFYCSPGLLDNVFSLAFTPVPSTEGYVYGYTSQAPSSSGDYIGSYAFRFDASPVFERDPLLHSIDFSYRKTSWLSTYGLPRL